MPGISSNKFVSFFNCLSVTEIQLYKQTGLLIYGQDSLSYKKLSVTYTVSSQYMFSRTRKTGKRSWHVLPIHVFATVCSLYPEFSIALCRRDFLV